jgi:hypothetical protein
MVGGLVTCTVVVSCAAGLALADDRSSNLEDAGLLPNLSAAAVFKPYLERMVRMSPTFRSQCKRLAAARRRHRKLAGEGEGRKIGLNRGVRSGLRAIQS